MLDQAYMQNLQQAMKSNSHVKVINNTAANGDTYTIKPYETQVIVDNDSSYTQSLLLPAVAESAGMILTIAFPDYGGGGTIEDQDDSLVTWSTLTNNADGEYAVLYNDGKSWLVLVTNM